MNENHALRLTLKFLGAFFAMCCVAFLPQSGFANSSGLNSGPGFNWDKWSAALNDDPCNWVPAEKITALYGAGAKKEGTTTRQASTCKWRDSEGKPVLTLTVHTWTTAKDVNHERDGQIAQLKSQGTTPFTEISSPHKVTTNILRQDRLLVYIFANDDKETAFVTINGHRVLNEKPELKKTRGERLNAVTQFFLEKYQF